MRTGRDEGIGTERGMPAGGGQSGPSSTMQKQRSCTGREQGAESSTGWRVTEHGSFLVLYMPSSTNLCTWELTADLNCKLWRELWISAKTLDEGGNDMMEKLVEVAETTLFPLYVKLNFY